MITREQCLKWADEAGVHLYPQWASGANPKFIEALCQRVWNEAIEAAELEASGDYGNVYVAEAVRKLKVTK